MFEIFATTYNQYSQIMYYNRHSLYLVISHISSGYILKYNILFYYFLGRYIVVYNIHFKMLCSNLLGLNNVGDRISNIFY